MSMAFGTPRILRDIGFRHLQLHPECVSALENLDLLRLGDLADCPPSYLDGHAWLIPAVRRHALLLSKHVDDAGIQWSGFWNEDEIELHWLAMTFNSPGFGEDVMGRTLVSLYDDFGALLHIPRASGLQTFGELVGIFQTGSRPWRGYGAAKIAKLGTKLLAISENPQTLSNLASADDDDLTNLPEAILSWGIDALGLGTKTDKLKRHGRLTLASLMDDQHSLGRIPSVGKRTVSLINERISQLKSAVIDGQLDLDRLAETQGVAIFPTRPDFEGGEMAHVVSELIRSVSLADVSEVASLIAEHRICIPGSQAVTLEAIASMPRKKITRERVRQIEKRILGRVAGLLMRPFPDVGEAVVRASLKQRFWDLSIALAEQDEISPANLGIVIAKEWNCSLADAFRALPMVMAIIEGTARSSAELKRLGDSPDSFFCPIGGVGGRWPVQNVGAERNLSQKFNELRIITIEDLRLTWIGGQDFGRHEQYIECVLTAACSDPCAELNFAEKLGSLTERAVVPKENREWADYIDSVCDDVATIIQNGTFWSDAKLIFDRRTSRLPNERITMEALGEKVGRLGVTIKRTETETLERLASAILDGQEGYVQCILRPDWIEMWRELQRIYKRFPADQRTFRRSVEEVCEIDDVALTMAMPTIWAILSGLPTRKSYGKAKVENAKPNYVLAPVRLAGFRTAH